MDVAVPDCLVSGYEQLIPALELPDKNDCHVLAAAIVGKASVIVTFNGNDFPPAAVDRYGIHTKHPDEFLLDVDGIHSGVLVNAAIREKAHYTDPPIPLDRYLQDLRNAGVPQTADHLEERRVLFDTE
jgi:hypothetical protein